MFFLCNRICSLVYECSIPILREFRKYKVSGGKWKGTKTKRKDLAAWPEIPSCQIYSLVAVMFNHRKVLQMRMLIPFCHAATTGGVRQFETLGTHSLDSLWCPTSQRVLYTPLFAIRYSSVSLLSQLYASVKVMPRYAKCFMFFQTARPLPQPHVITAATSAPPLIASHALEEGIQCLGAQAIGMAIKCSMVTSWNDTIPLGSRQRKRSNEYEVRKVDLISSKEGWAWAASMHTSKII